MRPLTVANEELLEGVDPVTGLTAEQREVLVVIMEEASEVAKAAAKYLRHGRAPSHGGVKYDNAADLKSELHDLLAMWERAKRVGLAPEGDTVDLGALSRAWVRKSEFLCHQVTP